MYLFMTFPLTLTGSQSDFLTLDISLVRIVEKNIT